MELPRVKVNKSGREIRYEFIECTGVWNYTIWEKNNYLGRAIVIQHNPYKQIIDKEEEIFLDIVIFETENRRKGAGQELMNFITSNGFHKCLISSAFSNKGNNFAYKTNWKLKKGMFGKEPDVFYFKVNQKKGE